VEVVVVIANGTDRAQSLEGPLAIPTGVLGLGAGNWRKPTTRNLATHQVLIIIIGIIMGVSFHLYFWVSGKNTRHLVLRRKWAIEGRWLPGV
jgi:hypothetical protein